jgi:O-antigen ligase
MANRILNQSEPERGLLQSPAGAHAGLLPLTANAILFFFGAVSWLFKLGDEKIGTVLPVSPTQIGLPIFGLIALFVIAQVWKLYFPPLAIRAWSMRIVNIGILLMLVGSIVHVARGGEYRVDAILYFGRWLLPWSALLTVALCILAGAQTKYLVYGLLFGCVVSVLCVEATRFGVPLPLEKMGNSRFGGLTPHPNDYGILISSTAPFIVYLLHEKSWFIRLFGFGLLPVYLLALFESLSKTNLLLFPLAMAVTFIAYSLNDVGKMLRTLFFFGISVFVGSFLCALSLEILQQTDPKQVEILTQFATNPDSVGSLDDRQNAWDEAGSYIHLNPWVGQGPGWSTDHLMFTHAHNMFLQGWIDVGILGLIGSVLLTVGLLIRNWEVFSRAVTRKSTIDSELRMQLACGIALLTSILGNSASASLLTPTMQAFSMLIAISFFNPNLKPLFGIRRASPYPVSIGRRFDSQDRRES